MSRIISVHFSVNEIFKCFVQYTFVRVFYIFDNVNLYYMI